MNDSVKWAYWAAYRWRTQTGSPCQAICRACERMTVDNMVRFATGHDVWVLSTVPVDLTAQHSFLGE